MIVMLTYVKGEEPTTDRAQDAALLNMKAAAYAKAETLRNARKAFHIYIANAEDASDVYLEIYNQEGCLRPRGGGSLPT